MRDDAKHEQEWRDWIKLTKREKSKNEVYGKSFFEYAEGEL